MYKSIAYPYCGEFSAFLRHSSLLNNISIVSAISPKGWGLCNKDASIADCGSDIGLIVADNSGFDSADFDSLLLVDATIELDFKKIILPKIKMCAEKGKSILSARHLSPNNKSEIATICNQNGVDFVDYSSESDKFDDPYVSEKLMDMHTPVVFVCGTAQNTNKFEIQLALREELLNRGFKVSQIASRHFCEIIGVRSWPFFMSDRAYTENEKIVLLNHYIKHIELSENPDIIIIGIPGGILPINNNDIGEFGMTAIEVSQSLVPDYAITSSLYEHYKEEYFTKLREGIKNRFNFDVDINNWSNVMIDHQNIEDGKEPGYLKLPYNFISSKISNFSNADRSILNIYESNAPKIIADDLINKLSQYGNMMTV